MLSRLCTKAAMNLINNTKTLRAKTLRCPNGFPTNFAAIRELSKVTWPMAATCPSVAKKQMSYESFSRGKSSKPVNIRPIVVHDRIGKRFYIADEDGIGRCFLKYEHQGEVIKIMYTKVPEAFSGRGYANLLVQEALDFVARNDYRLQIRCGFVRAYVKKNAPHFLKKH